LPCYPHSRSTFSNFSCDRVNLWLETLRSSPTIDGSGGMEGVLAFLSQFRILHLTSFLVQAPLADDL